MNKWLKALKIIYPDEFKDGLHPHMMRHIKATHLYMKGLDLISLRDFLGHESVKTTEIYASPDITKIRDSLMKSASNVKTNDKYSNQDKSKMTKYLKKLIKNSR